MPMVADTLPFKTGVESQSTSSVGDQILENFRGSKSYRHAFVEEKVRTGIALQIRAIREKQEMKRPKFASLMNKAPSWVFRLEDPNQPPPTISTLLQVAEAFDVDLEIRFGRFSRLIDRLDQMDEGSLRVPSFDEELEAGVFDKSSETSRAKDNVLRMPSGAKSLLDGDGSRTVVISGQSSTETLRTSIGGDTFGLIRKRPTQELHLHLITRDTVNG